MPVNFVKIVELLAIEKKENRSFLHIKMHLQQEVELFWEIDTYTAEQLTDVIESGNMHKYRLSLQIKNDSISKHYNSYVTRTYLNTSNRMNFSCSEHYKTQMEQIRQCAKLSDIYLLPFITKDLPFFKKEQPSDFTESTLNAVDLHSNETQIKPSENRKISTKNDTQSEQDPIEKSSLENKQVIQPTQSIETMNEKKEDTISNNRYNYRRWVPISLIGIIVVFLGIVMIFTLNNSTQTAKSQTPAIDTANNINNADKIPSLTVDQLMSFNVPEEYVALTFNGGPTSYTIEIMDILNDYQVGGTFFFFGDYIEKYPESVKTVQANGYAIGTLTMNKTQIDTLSYEDQKTDLINSTKAIEKITNNKVHLFRPPGGLFNKQTQEVMQEYGLKGVLWSINPEEAKIAGTNQLINFFSNSKLPGSIILLQESKEVVDALPKLIEMAQEQNLKVVSIN